jgi:hypothetical protein
MNQETIPSINFFPRIFSRSRPTGARAYRLSAPAVHQRQHKSHEKKTQNRPKQISGQEQNGGGKQDGRQKFEEEAEEKSNNDNNEHDDEQRHKTEETEAEERKHEQQNDRPHICFVVMEGCRLILCHHETATGFIEKTMAGLSRKGSENHHYQQPRQHGPVQCGMRPMPSTFKRRPQLGLCI